LENAERGGAPPPPLTAIPSGTTSLSGVLDVVEGASKKRSGGVRAARTTLGETLAPLGARAYGPLLLFIGLIAVSPLTVAPGATWAIAALTLVVSTQLLLRRPMPWIPRRALKIPLPGGLMRAFVNSIRPIARVADGLVKPRLQILAEPPWVAAAAMICIVAALVTFPLGFVPFASFMPSLAICLVGLGLTAKDGLLLILSVVPLLATAVIASALV
jgi:hypothetical protein